MVEKHFKSTTRCYRCFCFILYTAARVSEHVRAGINTVSRGQKFAASAMGFTTAQSYRYVILPVAYRTVY